MSSRSALVAVVIELDSAKAMAVRSGTAGRQEAVMRLNAFAMNPIGTWQQRRGLRRRRGPVDVPVVADEAVVDDGPVVSPPAMGSAFELQFSLLWQQQRNGDRSGPVKIIAVVEPCWLEFDVGILRAVMPEWLVILSLNRRGVSRWSILTWFHFYLNYCLPLKASPLKNSRRRQWWRFLYCLQIRWRCARLPNAASSLHRIYHRAFDPFYQRHL